MTRPKPDIFKDYREEEKEVLDNLLTVLIYEYQNHQTEAYEVIIESLMMLYQASWYGILFSKPLLQTDNCTLLH